ncbi:MAG: DUF5677 domain-containing protein [Rhodocyclaceae bacterium]|nr:DUF5677 domain-containing protein [Rhodocyclaceae bacterium]
MDDWQDGFLSEPFDQVVGLVRERYAAWRALLYRVNRLAVKTQHTLEIHNESNVERYSGVLFARILATVQAAAILLERGLVSQSQILLRSALEAIFQIGAIARDRSIVDKLIEAHAAEQRRVASNVLRWKDPGLRQVAEEKLASEILQPFLNSDASALSAAILAEKAGLEDWYRSLYMVLSWPTHSSAIDLDRHVVLGPDGEPSEFRNEPEIEDQEPTWACAIELLLKSMLALENIFSNVEKDKVESCYAAARLLLAETAG